jgi:hypothetical protein
LTDTVLNGIVAKSAPATANVPLAEPTREPQAAH